MGHEHDAQAPPDLTALAQEHASGLRGAVRGVLGPTADVREVLADAFAKAWEALSHGKRPRDPVAWLFVVTLNTARDHRRRGQRREKRHIAEDVHQMELPTLQPGPTRAMERSEAIAAARSAIHELAEREREVFLLRTSGGLSYEACAEALGIPIGTAKTRMRRALHVLRAALAQHAPEAGRRFGT